MDSRRLSARARQPGHDRTFQRSEELFIAVANQCLPAGKYEVIAKPRTLAKIFGGTHGVSPEASITSRETGRMFFVEVKKQGERGNAEERAMKHHTVQFYRTLHDYLGYDYHPYVTIFCESLATSARYTVKFPYLIEEDHYFLWQDYEEASLCAFLQQRCADWLD